jgi:hypothetical protein
MTQDPNAEMVAASDFIVGIARKQLGESLDYSVESFKNLEAFIQHVKSQLSHLKKEGKLTEQTMQNASVSIGAYLGEVIRRHHGGDWVAKNAVMRTLVINGQEFSPILYIFQRLAKASAYGLENYWSDIDKKLYPAATSTDEPSVAAIPTGIINKSTEKTSLRTLVIIAVGALCIIGMFSVIIYVNIVRSPP